MYFRLVNEAKSMSAMLLSVTTHLYVKAVGDFEDTVVAVVVEGRNVYRRR